MHHTVLRYIHGDWPQERYLFQAGVSPLSIVGMPTHQMTSMPGKLIAPNSCSGSAKVNKGKNVMKFRIKSLDLTIFLGISTF